SNPERTRSKRTAARGGPNTSITSRASLMTAGQVSDKVSANGTATRTSIHAASVLQMVTFSLAAMSAALVNGRVAMNGLRFGFLTVVAVNRAMNGGVSSAASKT